MKNETLLSELEELCSKAGYTIRKEKGSFRGDSCIMEGDKLVVINRSKPIENQIAILARVMKMVDIEALYIKPAVRKKIAEWWDQLDRLENLNRHSSGAES